MKPRTLLLLSAAVMLAGVVVCIAPAFADTHADAAPAFVTKIPPQYRDWKFVSVAREEAPLDDIRVILGNDVTIKAYRDGKPSFPDGASIARLAYGYDASDENNQIFGRNGSFVAGHPKNGVQFMVKDSRRYAATGGWGYGQFENGKPVDQSKLTGCFPCHQAVQSRDFVFTRYAP